MEQQIVRVRWTDSSYWATQIAPSELEPPDVLVTVGWLVTNERIGAEAVGVCRDLCRNGDLRGVIVIPRSAIIELSTVAVPE